MELTGAAQLKPASPTYPGAAIVARLTSTPAIPIATAVVLGLLFIGEKSFWQDEAFSVTIARLPTLDLWHFLWYNEMHAAPYYMLLNPWTAFGTGEAVTRSLSVVIGAVAVLATYHVGQRYNVAFRAAMVLAVLPFFIQYEQEARGYTLLVAGSALSTLAFLRLTEKYTSLRALVYIVLGGAMVYIQPLGALVVAAHALGVLLFVPREMRVSLLLLFIPIGLVWLPMVNFSRTHGEVISWIPPLTVQVGVDYLVAVAGGLVMAIVLLALLAYGIRRDLVALWLIVPIVGTIAISLLLQPVFYPRYLIAVLPAIAIIVARNPRWALAGFLALSLVFVGVWYRSNDKDDWRTATASMTAEARPDDGVVFWPPYHRFAYAYYASAGEPIFPPTPWATRYVRLPGEIPTTIDNPRVWVISATDKTLPEELANALKGYHVERDLTFGTTVPWIRLYTKSGTP